MPGCVCHRQTRPGRKLLDAPLALAEMFEQFEPVRVAERLRNLRKASEDALFWSQA
jgi:hypothetical protein